MLIYTIVSGSNVPHLNNTNLNAFGQYYANNYGHDMTTHMGRLVDYVIYDAAPAGYFTDLQLLRAKPRETWGSDEKTYTEKTFGRRPVIATAGVGAGTSQVIPVSANSLTAVSANCIVAYPNNKKGVVTQVDTTAGTVSVRAMSGHTLPAVTASDKLAFVSTIAGDGRNKIDTYSRVETIERYNYIQMFARGTRFGRMELHKYNSFQQTDYLRSNKQDIMQQYRVDVSNAFWNGERGEVILDDGTPAKTMGGIYPLMTQAGSPNVTTTLATLPDAVEDMALSSEYGESGETKFLFGTPRLIHSLSQQYKLDKTRYEGGGSPMIAKLGLNMIDMESTKLVLVPIKRWEEASCFPEAWSNRLIGVDLENITCAEAWGENIVDKTPDIMSGLNQNRFSDFYIDGNFSIKMPNPLSNFWVDVQ